MNTNKIATGSVNRKLLAALAVLAVAFVVLAAVPAVATDSDAADPTTTYPDVEEGIIAAGFIANESTADTVISAIRGVDLSSDISVNTAFVIYNAGTDYTGYKVVQKIDGVEQEVLSDSDSTTASIVKGVHATYFNIDSKATTSNSDAIKKDFSTAAKYTVEITLGSGSNAKTLSVDIKGEGITFYQDVSYSSANGISIVPTKDFTIQGSTAVTGETPAVKTFFDIKPDSGYDGTVTIKDLEIDSPAAAPAITSYTAGSSNYTNYKDFDVVIDGVTINHDGTSATSDGQPFPKVGAYISTGGSVTIKDSKITEVGDVTTNMRMEASQVYGAKDVTFTGNTLSGFDRGLNLEGVYNVTVTGNTMELVSHQTAKAMKGVNLMGVGSVTTTDGKNTVTITGNDISFSGASSARYEVTVNDGSGSVSGATNATKFKDFTTDADVVMLEGSSNDSATIEVAGTMTLQSGASLIVMDSNKVTVDANAKLVVKNGASLIIEDAATANIALTGNLSVEDGGVVALKAVDSETGADTDVLIGSNSTLSKATDIKAAYALTYGTGGVVTDSVSTTNDGNTSTTSTTAIYLSGPALAYADQEISVGATPADGYMVVSVYAAESAENSTNANIPASYDSATGEYTFKMPAYAVAVTSSFTGAYSVTYVKVYEGQTGFTQIDQKTGLKNEAAVTTIEVPAEDGYVSAGWYTDAQCTKPVSDSTKIDKASIVLYALMKATNKVVVADSEGGSVIASPSNAPKDAKISLTAVPVDGYKLITLTVDGKKVVDNLNKTGDDVKTVYNDAVMGDSDMQVSAVFAKISTAKLADLGKDAHGTLSDVRSSSTATTGATSAVSSAKFATGETVYFTAKAATSTSPAYAVKSITVTAGSTVLTLGNGVSQAVDSNGSAVEDTYTFLMPSEDASVSAVFGPAYAVTFDAQDNNGDKVIVRNNGQSITSPTNVAVDNTVSVQAVAADKYSVVSVAVKETSPASGTDARTVTPAYEDGVYTFAMPSYAVTITVTFGLTQEIVDVVYTGNGDVTYEQKTVGVGGSIQITATPGAKAEVKDFKVFKADEEGKITAIEAGTEVTVKDPAEGSNVYTLTFNGAATGQNSTAKYYVNVTFTDVPDRTLTFKDNSADYVKIYSTYENGKLSGEYTVADNKATVPGGKIVYIEVAQREGSISNTVAVTHTDKTTEGTATITAGSSIQVTTIQSSNVRYFTVDGNDTLAVTYEGQRCTITIEAGANGTVAVQNGTTAVENGGIVDYDSVLTITATPAEGYVEKVLVNGEEIEAADGVYTTDHITKDTTISVTFAQAYKVTVKGDAGVAVEASETLAPADTEITLTITETTGYKLKTLTVAGEDVTADVEDGKYTFTITADTEVVAESESATPGLQPATQFIVSIVTYNGAPAVQITGLNGYVPAGSISILAFYHGTSSTQFDRSITLTYSEDDVDTSSVVAFVAIDATSSNDIFAGVATYTVGSVSVTSAVAPLELTSTAAATTQE